MVSWERKQKQMYYSWLCVVLQYLLLSLSLSIFFSLIIELLSLRLMFSTNYLLP